jgi:hypothetical protein
MGFAPDAAAEVLNFAENHRETIEKRSPFRTQVARGKDFPVKQNFFIRFSFN